MTEEHDSSAAEALFAEFLVQRETEGGLEFEAFCARHPKEADGLRKQFGDWERMRSLLDRLGVAGSLASQIRDKFGKGADPRCAACTWDSKRDLSLIPAPSRAKSVVGT